MLGLTEEVGSHKVGPGCLIGQHSHLAGTCRHVDSHALHAYLLLGTGHELVSWTKYFIYLWYALCAISHGTYGLYASSLEHATHSSHTCGIEYSWIHLSLL